MNILILGANSEISLVIAKQFAMHDNVTLLLASRNIKSLEHNAIALRKETNNEVRTFFFDAHDYKSHQLFYDSLPVKPDIAVIAFGLVGNHQIIDGCFDEAYKIISTNYIGAVSIINIIASDFSKRKKGIIVGISSISGEFPRPNDAVYCSSKKAFTTYLSALRRGLNKDNVTVITVLPGPTKTKLIKDLRFPEYTMSTPHYIGTKIYQSIKNKKYICYVPKYWYWLSQILPKFLPEKLYTKLILYIDNLCRKK